VSGPEELVAVVLPDAALPATDGTTVRLTELGTGRTILLASEGGGSGELADAGVTVVGVPGAELARALGRPGLEGLTLLVRDGRIEHVFAPGLAEQDVVAWLREHPV